MNNALVRAMEKGLVVRTNDENRSAWWAISATSLMGTATAREADKAAEGLPAKMTAPVKVNVITSGRY